jgi:pimeloyl-ACP methyl ester carboxylesterase
MVNQNIQSRLMRMREFEAPSAGIREEFMTPKIAGSRSVAILSTPLGHASSMGWVICHSFGLEQIYFQALETPLARQLAGDGFPVLRFHGQGYGDSDGYSDTISLHSHVRGVEDAVRILMESARVEMVGLIGARFGATVAVLAADSTSASRLVLWDPIVNGTTYTRYLSQLSAIGRVLTSGPDRNGGTHSVDILERDGVLDVLGFPLHRAVFEEIHGVDLLKEPLAFRGAALILQVSRAATLTSSLVQLRDQMNGWGASARLEVVADPEAIGFGQPRFMPQGRAKRKDSQQSLAKRLIGRTASWCGSINVGHFQSNAEGTS